MRALASHQCGPGSTPCPGGTRRGFSPRGFSSRGFAPRGFAPRGFAPRGFAPGAPVFPSPQKPTFPNSISIRNPRDTGLSVPDC